MPKTSADPSAQIVSRIKICIIILWFASVSYHIQHYADLSGYPPACCLHFLLVYLYRIIFHSHIHLSVILFFFTLRLSLCRFSVCPQNTQRQVCSCKANPDWNLFMWCSTHPPTPEQQVHISRPTPSKYPGRTKSLRIATEGQLGHTHLQVRTDLFYTAYLCLRWDALSTCKRSVRPNRCNVVNFR